MYRSFLLSMVLLMSLKSLSQSSVKGMVADTAKIPVPYCMVNLLRATDSAVVKEKITDVNGVFLFDSLAAGSYCIRLAKAGCATYVSQPVIMNVAPVDVGMLTILTTGYELAGVGVIAFKPTISFKNGTVIMNVENNMMAPGLTVLELLKQLPGVVFDVQGNITVNGKTGVGFMMNGRLQQVPAKQILMMLGSMPAGSVAVIELIKNPSAKYDAAGTAGLINIIAKKVVVKGFSGNASQNTSYGQRIGSVSGGTLNFRSNKLTVFTNASYWYRDIVTDNVMNRQISNGINTGSINSGNDGTNYKRALNIKAGLEYEISPKLTIGGGANTAPNTADLAQLSLTDIGAGIPLGYAHQRNEANNTERFNSPSANVYAQYMPDTNGTQLKFTADYTNFSDNYSGLNETRFYDNNDAVVSPMLGYRNLQLLHFNIYTQQLDLTKKIGRTLTLEAGAKASFVNNHSDFTLDRNTPGTNSYYTDTAASNNYDYKERILAGYLNFIKEWSRTGLQVGIRAEQTDVDAINRTNGYQVQQNYLNLFPNASLNYKLSEKNSFQFTYSYRIDRPGYDQLNPLRVFNDPLNYATGNPKLQPQYSHNLSAEFSFNSRITTSLSYVHTANSIYNYSYVDNALVQVDTSINYASGDQLVYSIFLQKQLGKWYSLQASANGMYGVRKGIINGSNTDIATVAYFITANNDILLPLGYKLQVNAVYNSPFKDGIQNYGARGSLDIALQKRFFKNKLTVTAQVNDVLHTSIVRCTNDLPGQSVYFSQSTDSRRARLMISYRFGNMRVDRKVHNDEEGKRIKKAS